MDALNPRMIYINLHPCSPGFCTNERILRNQYFLYVYSGKGSFKIGDTRYEAQYNDLFFCPKGIPNTITADERDPFILTGIDFECDISEVMFPQTISLTANIGHEELIREMIRSYADSSNLASTYCNALLKAFMINIIYFHQTKKSSPGGINDILRYISENNGVTATIEDAGKRFNYHPSTINRLVKNATGMSAKEYQIDVRLKKAKGLLLYSDRSVTEIASDCGYSDVFFFSRQFRNKVGVLPSKLRKKSSDTKM